MDIFTHQIQSEFYGGKSTLSIEGIDLEHFITIDPKKPSSSFHILTRYSVFHSFLSDNRKPDAATTAEHRKLIIGLLKKNECVGSGHSTIWENSYGFDEHYICATAI